MGRLAARVRAVKANALDSEDIEALPWYERLYMAMVRGLVQLKPELADRLLKLFDLNTLWAFLLLLGAWAAAQFLGLGAVADLAVGAYGLYALGSSVFQVGSDLWDFAKGAIYAKSEEDLDAAGKHFAGAMSEGVVTALETLLGGAVFKTFRRAVLKIKPVPKDAASRFKGLETEVRRMKERTERPEDLQSRDPRELQSRPRAEEWQSRPRMIEKTRIVDRVRGLGAVRGAEHLAGGGWLLLLLLVVAGGGLLAGKSTSEDRR